ncbi:MAG TPA: gephyrin-like molybdotransferase Glp [Blastocatellia bacterium]|nr:gephyrin-like molybdotransferase Glp [Blastocatellia bacterium]
MITVDQALAVVLKHIEPLAVETVPLEHALGRLLCEAVYADIDLPPFDRARMDGYAVRSSDVLNAPVSLRVIGEIAAGASFPGKINAGEAVKIFTGAPVPDGADAVQKIEVTESTNHTVEIREAVQPGQFITPRASEIAAGEEVLKPGCTIGPAAMAVLASFGRPQVRVAQRPRVAVFSTGSELVDVSVKPSNAQIRNSNSFTLAAYAERAGAVVEMLPVVEDTPSATSDALLRAAEHRDIVITSGGVSMGDYDLVEAALLEIGAEIFFDKIQIRPGKPVVFARRERAFFFCLPGNPVSTSVTFNVFVRPALRKMQHDAAPIVPPVTALLAHAIKDASSRRSYLPGRLILEDGRAVVEPLKWGGSSDLVAFMRANALIIVPEDVHEIAKGQTVEVFEIDN